MTRAIESWGRTFSIRTRRSRSEAGSASFPKTWRLVRQPDGHGIPDVVGRMYLLPRTTIRSRSAELLSLLGLENEVKKLTLEYSHGMKRSWRWPRAAAESGFAVSRRAIRRRGRRDLADDPGFAHRLRRPRFDGLFDVARPGDREKLCTHVGIIVKGAGRAGGPRRDSRGRHARRALLEKAGADSHAAPRLRCRGEVVVNFEHLHTVIWLHAGCGSIS